MLYKIYKFFEFPETVWYSFFIFMWLSFSTVITSFFLFREKKMYTITEIVKIFVDDDIMPPPTKLIDEYKFELRKKCWSGAVKATKIKGKGIWYIHDKKEALKYLEEYRKNKESRRKRSNKVSKDV